MSEPNETAPARAAASERRLAEVETGVRIFAATILLLSSAPLITLALSLPEGSPALFALFHPAPRGFGLTRFVLEHSLYFTVLAFLWPITGTIITLRAARPLHAAVASCVYLGLVTVQFALMWAAVALPIRATFRTISLLR